MRERVRQTMSPILMGSQRLTLVSLMTAVRLLRHPTVPRRKGTPSLSRLRSDSFCPACELLELMLPRFSGRRCAHHLRHRWYPSPLRCSAR